VTAVKEQQEVITASLGSGGEKLPMVMVDELSLLIQRCFYKYKKEEREKYVYMGTKGRRRRL
jgi:hypothetical protein